MAESPKKKARPGPKPDPAQARSTLVTIRCRSEWRDWLARFAKFKSLDMSEITDEALLRYARSEGFEMPPKLAEPEARCLSAPLPGVFGGSDRVPCRKRSGPCPLATPLCEASRVRPTSQAFC